MKLKYWIIIVLVALVGFLVWQYIGGTGDNGSEDSDTDVTEQQSDSNSQNQDVDVEEISNSLFGVLQNSSDRSRGNLMLLLDDTDRVIYLNTSRDYSQLVGKHVEVTIDGSLDDFRLVDIRDDQK